MATPLNYHAYGHKNNPALVLLHGFLGDQHDWQPLINALHNHFYCICIDLAGHGENQHIVLPIPGFCALSQMILDTLSALDINQFHLFGYSLGGRVALHVAQIAPQRLLSLQLESCHPGLTSQIEKQTRQINDEKWAEKLTHLPITDFVNLWYQQAIFANITEQEKQQLILIRSKNCNNSLLNCYQATSLALQQDLNSVPQKLFEQCQIQSYFYVGKQDHKFLSLAKAWRQKSHLQVITIENAGHNIHLAQPIILAQYIKNRA